MQIIHKLNGTADFDPEKSQIISTISYKLHKFLNARAYQIVNTPILENTDLFLRKSGGELAAKMYTFSDPSGRRVSLRPEFTSSVVRAYVEGTIPGKLPIRWQYSGTVFRYEPDRESRREHFQLGAELIGVDTPDADAEIIASAALALSDLGLRGHRIRIGHLSVINAIFENLGLSERARVFILSNLAELGHGVDAIARIRNRASELGLLSSRAPKELTSIVRRLESEDAIEIIEGFLSDTMTGPTGLRTSDEVMARYLRKLLEQENPEKIEQALQIGSMLVATAGAPGITLVKLRQILKKFKLSQAILSPIYDLITALSGYRLAGIPITLDISMARGIAYYSGMVFELEHPRLANTASLGGGGRYNGLVRALGGRRDIPALGFAYNLDSITKIIPRSRFMDRTNAQVLLISHSPDSLLAVKAAEDLRAQGITVELDILGQDESSAVRYARQKGIPKILMINSDGVIDERSVK